MVNASITRLDLSHNNIGSAGAQDQSCRLVDTGLSSLSALVTPGPSRGVESQRQRHRRQFRKKCDQLLWSTGLVFSAAWTCLSACSVRPLQTLSSSHPDDCGLPLSRAMMSEQLADRSGVLVLRHLRTSSPVRCVRSLLRRKKSTEIASHWKNKHCSQSRAQKVVQAVPLLSVVINLSAVGSCRGYFARLAEVLSSLLFMPCFSPQF